jgi:hypothetical protein
MYDRDKLLRESIASAQKFFAPLEKLAKLVGQNERKRISSLPVQSERPQDLSVLVRIAWILVIAVGVALAFGALVSAIEALARLTEA